MTASSPDPTIRAIRASSIRTRSASKGLMDALEKNRNVLDPALRSVGRIELTNNMQYPWVGTGWIIGSDLGSDIIVTNAHVGREFGMRSGDGYVFRPGIPNCLDPAIGTDRFPRRGQNDVAAGVSDHRYHLDFGAAGPRRLPAACRAELRGRPHRSADQAHDGPARRQRDAGGGRVIPDRTTATIRRRFRNCSAR